MINPRDRAAALLRARAQVADYARTHPGFEVLVDEADTPTEYELHFRERSVAPGADGAGEPVPTEHHQVCVVLGSGFPLTPPAVYWESPIFHPNIFPNYDSPSALAEPEFRGLVCLGRLADDYRPDFDFGELCQMLVDMAAFRNVSVFDLGDPAEIRANFYDKAAAVWLTQNPDRLARMLGRPSPPQRPAVARPFRNTVEPLGSPPAIGDR